MEQEKKLTEQESLHLITMMINKAKESYHDTGIGAIMWGAVIALCSLVRYLRFNLATGFLLIFTYLLLWPLFHKY